MLAAESLERARQNKKADRRGATAAGPLSQYCFSQKDNALIGEVNSCCETFCAPAAHDMSDFSSGAISLIMFGSRAAKAMFVFSQSIGLPMS